MIEFKTKEAQNQMNLLQFHQSQNKQNSQEKQLYETKIYQMRSHHKLFGVYCVIIDPNTEKSNILLDKLNSLINFDIYDFYSISKEQAQNLTVKEFIFDFQYELKQEHIKSKDLIKEYRQKFQSEPEKYDKNINTPLAFVRYTNPVQRINYSPYNFLDVQNQFFPTFRKEPIFTTNSFNIMSCEYLYLYPIQDEFLQELTILQTSLQQLERNELCNQFANSIQLKNNQYNISDLVTILQSPSYNYYQNYELFETVGDVVLKYIVSSFLFISNYENWSAGQMTSIRGKMINNKFLGIQSYKMQSMYYLSNKPKRHQEYQFPLHIFNKDNRQKIKNNSKTQLKNLADMLEALYGIVIIKNFNIKDTLQVFENTLELDLSILQEEKQFLCEDIQIMPNNIKEYEINELVWEINSSLNFLIGLSGFINNYNHNLQKNKQIQLQCNITHNNIDPNTFFSQLENDIQYSFKNKNLLIEAFNCQKFKDQMDYEKLEYLGDSIIEMLLIPNVYKAYTVCNKNFKNLENISKCFKFCQIHMNPATFSKFKHWLLSNQFFAKISYALDLPKYLINLKEKDKNLIKQYYQDYQQQYIDQAFIQYNRSLQSPKILGDIIESLIAALLLDGGWSAVIKVFGPLYKNLIIFLINNENQLVNDIEQQILDDYNCQIIINQNSDQQNQQFLQYQGIAKCKGEVIQQVTSYSNNQKQLKEIVGYKVLQYFQTIEQNLNTSSNYTTENDIINTEEEEIQEIEEEFQ